MEISISEGLSWMKTLKARHKELCDLRNEHSVRETRLYGQKDREVIKKELYDVVALDGLITTLAKEIRLLDMQIKRQNASTILSSYTMNEDVLGNIEAARAESKTE